MNNKKIVIGLVVVALIATLGLYFPRGNSVVRQVTEKLGAVASLDGVDNAYVKINGVETAYISQPINATSTMLCNIKNPYMASSTLLSFSMRVTDGITGANNFSLSTSSTYYGSSTPALVLNKTIPAGSTMVFAWTPSSATTTTGILPGISADGSSNILLNNGEYVVVRLATTTAAGALGDYYDGQCSAVFQRI